MQFNIEESDRQLLLRGLAIQALRDPGFETACRSAAETLGGVQLYANFLELLRDVIPKREGADHGA